MKRYSCRLIIAVLIVCAARGILPAASLCTGSPADYVIVTSNSWISSFSSYASTKSAQGIATRVFGTADIYANYSGADNREKIRNFIIDAYNTWSISYVLLGGDENVIPCTTGPEDRYYYDLDAFPMSGYVTVFGGRLPTSTKEKTKTMTEYWCQYESTGAWTRKYMYCAWGSAELDDISKFTAVHSTNAATVQSAINNGCGIAYYFAHGWYTMWSEYSYNPWDHVTKLTNGAKLPCVFASACLTGNFAGDDNAISQKFFEVPGGGAIAYIGAWRVIDFGEAGSAIQNFFDGVRGSYYDDGRVHFCGGFFLNGGYGSFHFLGDPTAFIDLRMPGDSTPPVISTSAVSPIQVMAYNPVSCSITATDNDDVSSQVWMSINCPDSSTTTITLTRQGTTNDYTDTFYLTTQTGTYTVTAYAKDISGNQSSLGCNSFNVIADAAAPIIDSSSVDKVSSIINTPVRVSLHASDNVSLGAIYISVTKPDSSVVYSTDSYMNITWPITETGLNYDFTETGQEGKYQVSIRAADKSGNESSVSIVNILDFPGYAFEVINDTTPPSIAGAWFVGELGMMTTTFDHIAVSSQVGTNLNLFIEADDEAVAWGALDCWVEVLLATGTVNRYDTIFCGPGMYPPAEAYSARDIIPEEPGLYYATGYARDNVGNITSSTAVINIYRPPSSLTGTPGDQCSRLTWTPAASGYPIAGYNVYWVNTKLNGALLDTNTYYHGGLTNGGGYLYSVEAVDSAGNNCGRSNSLMINPTSSTVAALAPIAVTSLAGDMFAGLSWQEGVRGSSPIAGYWIYRSTYSLGQSTTPINASLLTGTTHQDTSCINGTPYYYRVASADTAGIKSALSPQAFCTPYAPPGSSAMLMASGGNGFIELSWTTAGLGTYEFAGYCLYRATFTGGQGITPVVTASSSSAVYIDSGVVNGTQYFYTMRAKDIMNNLGPASMETPATPDIPVPQQPSGIFAEAMPDKILLQWQNNASTDCVTYYNVYRDTAPNLSCIAPRRPGQIAYNEFSLPIYSDTNTVSGKIYYYKTTAVNARAESSPSVEVSTAVPLPNFYVVKSTSTSYGKPGEEITITLTYGNSGAGAATNIVITDFVPFNSYIPEAAANGSADSVEYYVGSSWQGAYSIQARKIRWKNAAIPALTAGLAVSYKIKIR